jgi:alkylation response protein AidB-like acyl-CoA dehydrogenase
VLDATLTRNTDLALSVEQQDFVRALRDFAAKEVTTELRESVENDHHSDEMAARLAELGWWSLTIDEEYGGSAGAFSDAVLFLEETARGQIPVAGYGVTLIVVGALNKFGTEDQ